MRASIKHHSLSRARSIAVPANLAVAKRVASKEFGDEQNDFLIVIYTEDNKLLSSKKVGAKKWQDATQSTYL